MRMPATDNTPQMSAYGTVTNLENMTPPNYLWLFPIFFVGGWLIVTTLLGSISHWYALMRAFPNREALEVGRLKSQSGSMGGVGMRGILSISVCQSGLRFGILRVFGPFCRDFFVPWEQLRVERKNGLLGKTTTLRFGEPWVGWLRIPSHLADRLARSSGGCWPEAGPFPEESRSEIFASVFRDWLIGTTLASLFFIAVPRLAAANAKNDLPIAVSILFPAVVFGIAAAIQYVRRLRGEK